MSGDIVHPGNEVLINCSRCAMDSLKYSRNWGGSRSISVTGEQKESPPRIIKRENSRLLPLSEVPLDSGHFLYISKEPATWFIGTRNMKTKLSGGLGKLEERDLNFLYGKGVLEIGRVTRNVESLNGPHVTRTDNTALISITDKCNLDCGHCVASANQNELGDELSSNELEDILKTIGAQENPFGLDIERKIFLSGGEPLIRKDVGALAKTSCEYNLSTHICTNGIGINENLLNELEGFPVSFLVSCDGRKENHELIRGRNTYDVTVKHMKDISKKGYDLFLNNFLHQENFSDMEHVVELALDLGARGVNFIRAIPRGRGKDMTFRRVPDKYLFSRIYELMGKCPEYYDLLENENSFPIMALSAVSGIKSLNCGLSRENYFFLDSGGNVFPCPGMRYDEFRLGNVREKGLDELVNGRRSLPMTSLRADEFPTCSKCEYTFFCGGDCRGSAYGNSDRKTLKAPVPYCSERKESMKELFNILSLNPNFMKEKSMIIIENAREETKLYENVKA